MTAANTLLYSLLDATAGDAELYLEGLEQTADGLELRFGYQVGGVPIRFPAAGAPRRSRSPRGLSPA